MHDLGNWAAERYRLAGPPPDDLEPDPSEDENK